MKKFIFVTLILALLLNNYQFIFAYGNNTQLKKEVYLTFDDGPSEYATRTILNILDKYSIKATFFVVGKMVEKHPDILKEEIKNGHTIGIHSYTHKYKEIYFSEKNILEDIILTEKTIKNVYPEFKAVYYRFPGGEFNLPEEIKKVPIKLGLTVIGWNSVIGDGELNDKTPETYMNIFKSSVKNKNSITLLMHDGAYKCTTASILPDIIEYFIKNNYTFKTLK